MPVNGLVAAPTKARRQTVIKRTKIISNQEWMLETKHMETKAEKLLDAPDLR